MFINDSEKNAIREVVNHGREWGFGNMIDRLQAAWAKNLLEKYPEMSIEAALGAGFRNDEERVNRLKKVERGKLIKSLGEYIGE
jgi:hypothetical protein